MYTNELKKTFNENIMVK